MRVLITGFGPFPGAPFNPSAALANALARRRRPALAGIERATHIFATTYASVDRDLPKLLAQKPDIVLMFGVAGRRRQLCIETRARNAVSLLFPDASGRRPVHGVIKLRGPAALTGNAPFARLAGAAGTKARLSRDAGTLSVQLRLLAGPGTRARHPAAGAIRSYPAGERQAAAAPTREKAADARPTSETRRSAAHRPHRRKPALTVNAGTSRVPH